MHNTLASQFSTQPGMPARFDYHVAAAEGTKPAVTLFAPTQQFRRTPLIHWLPS